MSVSMHAVVRCEVWCAVLVPCAMCNVLCVLLSYMNVQSAHVTSSEVLVATVATMGRVAGVYLVSVYIIIVSSLCGKI